MAFISFLAGAGAAAFIAFIAFIAFMCVSVTFRCCNYVFCLLLNKNAVLCMPTPRLQTCVAAAPQIQHVAVLRFRIQTRILALQVSLFLHMIQVDM